MTYYLSRNIYFERHFIPFRRISTAALVSPLYNFENILDRIKKRTSHRSYFPFLR